MRSVAVGLAVSLLLLVDGSATTSTALTGGPLVSANDVGAVRVALAYPGSHPRLWSGMFGDALCTRAGEVHIRSVEARTPVAPVALRFLVRKGRLPDVAMIASKRGGARHLPGKTTAPSGSVVRDGCAPHAHFTELLVVMRATRAGAVVDRVKVRYEVGGRLVTRTIHATYVLCGSKTHDTGLCPGDLS